MGYNSQIDSAAAPLVRPSLLIETARVGARRYCRARDLAPALPGFTGGTAQQVVARLGEAELNCEDLRRARSPAYRPAVHVQVLSALLAEAAQAKASGSDSLRFATKSRRPSSMPGSSAGAA